MPAQRRCCESCRSKTTVLVHRPFDLKKPTAVFIPFGRCVMITDIVQAQWQTLGDGLAHFVSTNEAGYLFASHPRISG